MDLSGLQERLINLVEREEFVELEILRDEFSGARLEGFEQFVEFTEDSYLSKTLFRTDKFEIRLLCWKPFQETPKHHHPENGCLMKILEGKLIEEKFGSPRNTTTVFETGDVGYIKAPESHVLRNADVNSVSLHIYSPSGFYDNVR